MEAERLDRTRVSGAQTVGVLGDCITKSAQMQQFKNDAKVYLPQLLERSLTRTVDPEGNIRLQPVAHTSENASFHLTANHSASAAHKSGAMTFSSMQAFLGTEAGGRWLNLQARPLTNTARALGKEQGRLFNGKVMLTLGATELLGVEDCRELLKLMQGSGKLPEESQLTGTLHVLQRDFRVWDQLTSAAADAGVHGWHYPNGLSVLSIPDSCQLPSNLSIAALGPSATISRSQAETLMTLIDDAGIKEPGKHAMSVRQAWQTAIRL